MQILVMRHGRTDFNEKGLINGFLDDPLSEKGKEQAHAAVSLIPSTIKRIYASPLARTRETAEIVNQDLKARVVFCEGLKEVNFGEFNGTLFTDEFRKKHETLQYDWRPTGESFEDVKERVVKVLHDIEKENDDGEALLVAHGGIIRLLAYLESKTILGRIENASLHSYHLPTILKNANPA